MVFFVILVKTRMVEIAGIATNPDGRWMEQMARNLTDTVDGFLRKATYLIYDHDPLFTESFEAILGEGGVNPAGVASTNWPKIGPGTKNAGSAFLANPACPFVAGPRFELGTFGL